MVAELTPQGILEKCPKCQWQPKRRSEPKAATPKPATPIRIETITDGDRSLVDQVRSRLASVEVELERHETLKRERTTLRAMLKAAERKR